MPPAVRAVLGGCNHGLRVVRIGGGRRLAKTMTYAVMHLTVAIGVAFAITGNWAIALSVGLLEPAVQTVFFALHERLWEGRAECKARRAEAREKRSAGS